ncbi:putative pyridine nucleotide-disulfide oxidoreductase RclA [bioreactor metagenome]|uniref:Putative pyridine nucleotide-disulfide oxidoreductase RclA n=1 Tax=bioreactor metagenome TaxID=1076179 RepID=A0A644V7S1_9ZZZZ|nr:FAD-dependent oxidoreductase [Methanocorpusculum sp.]
MQKFDVILIGIDKTGKILAKRSAAAGKSVAVIDKSAEIPDGTSVDQADIVSHFLVHKSDFVKLHPGLSFDEKDIWYRRAIQEKRRFQAMLAKNDLDELEKLENVTVFRGSGSIIVENEVRILSSKGTSVISGSKIVSASVNPSTFPEISWLDTCSIVYTREMLMDLVDLPKRLVILGGSQAGLETASIYAGFGCAVTFLEENMVFLAEEDEDIAAEIKKALEERGVTFKLGAHVEKIAMEQRSSLISFIYEGQKQEIHADAILISPRVDPAANGDTRTSSSICISPPFSRVGQTEREARAAGYNVLISNLAASSISKAQVIGQMTGMMKTVIDADTKKILGAALFCAGSDEIISIIQLAMDQDADYMVLRDLVFPYPTIAEALNELFSI